MIKKHATAKSARQGGLVTSVHVTETCEKESPHLITHVATTAATTTDEAMTETIHAELEQTDLTPCQHLRGFWLYHGTDPGLEPATLRHSASLDPGVRMCAWQANTDDGIDVSQFRLDWDQQQATCPQGHTSMSWTPAIDHRKNEVIKIKFSRHRLRRVSSADPLYPL